MVAITHFTSFYGRHIETTVTNEVSIAKNWILSIQSLYQHDPTVIISLNSKTNPQDSSKISTLQLCVKTKCLIFQLNKNPNHLEDIFCHERFVFVGISIAETVKKLDGVMISGNVKKVDVRDLVKMNYPFSYGESSSRVSLKAMACELLGFGSWKPKKRKICFRDFAKDVLDEEAIMVLAVDAYVTYEIGFKMLTLRHVL